MTDGSLFDLNDIPSQPLEDEPQVAAPVAPEIGATPAARDAAAPKSLYRKYRPQSFDAEELFGQDHIVNTLKNAIALDRIAHAYLFCGPRGTGKTTTARLLAKAVNCLDPDPANRPCNKCAACVAINNGSSTDVIEIDAASNRGIDDIRDLRERVKYAPSQLKTKFYIIDEAHQITGAAANAFLKTLEEPPAHTKFILATTDPEELLQTIVSRCQRFDFRRIPLDAMVANLTRVAKAEHIEIDDEAKTAIARHATGSMRDALGLLDQVAVYRENVDDENTLVTLDLVRTVLGVSRNDRVEAIVAALADKDAGAGLRAIGEAVEAGDDMRQLARQLLAYLRLLLLERAGGETELDEAGTALAQRFTLGELAMLTQRMGDIDFKVKHATISQLPLEIAVVEGALRDQQPVAAAATQPAQHPSQGYAPPERAPQSAPAPQAVAAAGTGPITTAAGIVARSRAGRCPYGLGSRGRNTSTATGTATTGTDQRGSSPGSRAGTGDKPSGFDSGADRSGKRPAVRERCDQRRGPRRGVAAHPGRREGRQPTHRGDPPADRPGVGERHESPARLAVRVPQEPGEHRRGAPNHRGCGRTPVQRAHLRRVPDSRRTRRNASGVHSCAVSRSPVHANPGAASGSGARTGQHATAGWPAGRAGGPGAGGDNRPGPGHRHQPPDRSDQEYLRR